MEIVFSVGIFSVGERLVITHVYSPVESCILETCSQYSPHGQQ